MVPPEMEETITVLKAGITKTVNQLHGTERGAHSNQKYAVALSKVLQDRAVPSNRAAVAEVQGMAPPVSDLEAADFENKRI